MRRLLVIAVMSAALMLGSVIPASAQAGCQAFGQTAAAEAQAGRAEFGGFVSAAAKEGGVANLVAGFKAELCP